MKNKLYGIWVLDKALKDESYLLLSVGDDLEQGRAYIYYHKKQAQNALTDLKYSSNVYPKLEIKEINL